MVEDCLSPVDTNGSGIFIVWVREVSYQIFFHQLVCRVVDENEKSGNLKHEWQQDFRITVEVVKEEGFIVRYRKELCPHLRVGKTHKGLK